MKKNALKNRRKKVLWRWPVVLDGQHFFEIWKEEDKSDCCHHVFEFLADVDSKYSYRCVACGLLLKSSSCWSPIYDDSKEFF